MTKTRKYAIWGLAGLAGASAITAIVLTVVGKGNYSDAENSTHCSRDDGNLTCDAIGTQQIHDAQGLADIGTGFAIGAGLALAGAAALYLTRPHDTVVVTPTATAHSGGVSVSIRF